MSIPTKLLQSDFQINIEPYLSKARRGYVSSIPLYKIFNYILYKLYTGCQWHMLSIDNKEDSTEKEISYQAIYYHFRKWCRDGSFKKMFKNSVLEIKDFLNLSELNFDGTHTIAKKGGDKVSYQGRKKAKTTNILPVTDADGNIVATTDPIAGNHNDAYQLNSHLKQIFQDLKTLKLDFNGAHFNMDAAFDTKDARKTCWNYQTKPNISENKRGRKKPKRGRKRYFNSDVYKNRFSIERTFAWVDKFRALIIRFERLDRHFLGFNFIAFTMVNLRNLIGQKV